MKVTVPKELCRDGYGVRFVSDTSGEWTAFVIIEGEEPHELPITHEPWTTGFAVKTIGFDLAWLEIEDEATKLEDWTIGIPEDTRSAPTAAVE